MMTKNEVEVFLKILIQGKEILKEFLELSKKKPNDPVNKFKLGFVNTILEQSNNILGKDNTPFNSFKVFSEDELPTNSDVVLILSQYVVCLKKFGRDNVEYNDTFFKHYWIIKGGRYTIEADVSMLQDR